MWLGLDPVEQGGPIDYVTMEFLDNHSVQLNAMAQRLLSEAGLNSKDLQQPLLIASASDGKIT